MPMFIRYVVRSGWASFLALTSLTAQAQSGISPDVLERLKNLQNIQIKSAAGSEAKGWTCRTKEDGRRLHRMDPTNIAHMGTIASSVAGFRDNTTPLARLPVCTEPI